MGRFEDGVLIVTLTPPTSIAGWSLRFITQKAFGGISGFIFKYSSSGLDGMSGITILNSGQGVFQVNINSADTSGLDYGNYATTSERMDSGMRTTLTNGYLLLLPTGAP